MICSNFKLSFVEEFLRAFVYFFLSLSILVGDQSLLFLFSVRLFSRLFDVKVVTTFLVPDDKKKDGGREERV